MLNVIVKHPVLQSINAADHGSTLSVIKSLYMDGVPTNIYQWRLCNDSVGTQVVSLLHHLT